MGSHGGYVSEILLVNKTADQNLINDASLNDDPDLTIPIAAGENMFVEFFVHYQALAGGIRASVNGPAAATHLHYTVKIATGVGLDTSNVETVFDQPTVKAGATQGFITITLGVHNGVNAGNIVFRWAQNGADANNTTVHEDSYVRAMRLSP